MSQRKFMSAIRAAIAAASWVMAAGCGTPAPGPDKQFAGAGEGAITGAGAGAVTGFQLGAGTGPGAAIGAGFGAVAGGIHGFLADQAEENLMKMAAETRKERQRAIAHEILEDHYKRRMALYPSRDIYPADLFFYGDESRLRPEAKVLIHEIARMNKTRLPWSRLTVAAYTISKDNNSVFAKRLGDRRAREICDHFVMSGVEARRMEARSVVIEKPLVMDPNDRPDRYGQAIELIPLDR